MDIKTRACNIKLMILDVDGVLTNGQIIFGRDGEAMKEFNAQDGLGISVAHKAGLKTAIITGRESDMVRLRGAELKITDIYQGAMTKLAALSELAAKYQLNLNEICYVGDDLIDLPVMVKVGLACAVANAVPEVKANAHYTTTKTGGNGAVREVVELVLKAQNKWEDIIAAYTQAIPIETKQ
jgi:3-deoxy-D-manno-octulosonate 8-phosphate phosphatase (KDO 8-P phosphatase)